MCRVTIKSNKGKRSVLLFYLSKRKKYNLEMLLVVAYEWNSLLACVVAIFEMNKNVKSKSINIAFHAVFFTMVSKNY